LEELSNRSKKIASELLDQLLRFKSRGGSGRWGQALHAVLNKEKIEETIYELERVRNELQFGVVVSIKTDMNTIALQNNSRLMDFDRATREIIQAILKGDTLAAHRYQEILNAVELLPSRLKQPLTAHIQQPSVEEVRKRIKDCLWFSRIDDRYQDIAQAHQRTCEWIYTHSPRYSFSDWLRFGNGIYWICGKAGSGKSTLMKFLVRDPRTRKGLEHWANGVPLLVSSFYFWRHGTDMQRSQKGLLQSLLYAVLEQRPELDQVLFPQFFNRATANWSDFPTYRQLKEAFNLLAAQKIVSVKIAFIIDGLDEYEKAEIGMDELTDLFKSAATSSNVKLIMSGRPLRVLEKAFEDCPQLRLEDLTKGDITTYVNDHIRRNPRLAELIKARPSQASLAQEFVADIVEAASGVFLWVRFVVRSLLEGFQNHDTIRDLQRRLQELPQDLEQLFVHMLSQVSPFYKVQSSQIFQIFRAASEVNVSRGSFKPLKLTALGLSFAQEDTASVVNFSRRPISECEARARVQEIEARLKSHCAGLLELRRGSRSNDSDEELDQGKQQSRRRRVVFGTRAIEGSVADYLEQPEEQIGSGQWTVPEDPEVQYLHRTVADFLEKPEVRIDMEKETMDTGFDAYSALLRSCVLRMKTSARVSCYVKEMVEITLKIERFTGCAAEEELLHSADRVLDWAVKQNLTDEVRQKYMKHFGETPIESAHWYHLYQEATRTRYRNRQVPAPWDTFLTFAVNVGFTLYVKKQFRKHGSTLIWRRGRPLLLCACSDPPAMDLGNVKSFNREIIEILLEHGADPNEKFDGKSSWEMLLYSFHRGSLDADRALPIFKLMVSKGADVNISIEDDYSREKLSALSIIQKLYDWRDIQQLQKEEIDELVTMVKSHGAKEQECDSWSQQWHEVEQHEQKDPRIDKRIIRKLFRRHLRDFLRLKLRK